MTMTCYVCTQVVRFNLPIFHWIVLLLCQQLDCITLKDQLTHQYSRKLSDESLDHETSRVVFYKIANVEFSIEIFFVVGFCLVVLYIYVRSF
jgi:hypothetical protein